MRAHADTNLLRYHGSHVRKRRDPSGGRTADRGRRPRQRHRPPAYGPASPFVHDLPRHREAVGLPGAPRLPGIDERGREILTFLGGETLHDHGSPPLSDDRLANAARLTRRFHDATEGPADRTKAANIFGEMVRWIDGNAGDLERFARG